MQKTGWGLLFAICIMPKPDMWSNAKPTAAGVVKTVNVEKNDIELEKGLHISWSDSTMMFTQFGGAIDVEELKPGDSIEVWTPDCKLTKGKPLKSVVIRVHK